VGKAQKSNHWPLGLTGGRRAAVKPEIWQVQPGGGAGPEKECANVIQPPFNNGKVISWAHSWADYQKFGMLVGEQDRELLFCLGGLVLKNCRIRVTCKTTGPEGKKKRQGGRKKK